MKRFDWPAPPMILGLVLGPMFESSLRQSLTISHGTAGIFITRPISAALMLCAVLFVVVPVVAALYARRAAPAPAG